jgi:hypothetical protein
MFWNLEKEIFRSFEFLTFDIPFFFNAQKRKKNETISLTLLYFTDIVVCVKKDAR